MKFLGLFQTEEGVFCDSGEKNQEKVLCGDIMYIIIDYLGLQLEEGASGEIGYWFWATYTFLCGCTTVSRYSCG
jgi:hypothetical protein